jgi:uncharacterized membrane protein YiaA
VETLVLLCQGAVLQVWQRAQEQQRDKRNRQQQQQELQRPVLLVTVRLLLLGALHATLPRSWQQCTC